MLLADSVCPILGLFEIGAPPIRFSEAAWEPRGTSPGLGSSNAEIYGKLGYSSGDLERLASRGVI